jgi:two-component system, cell cycle sensor histidine kinase and response regulator CckA
MNVLIVDDNETNRKLLRVTLHSEGHHTVEACDGIEGLEILKSEPVDAIVSDILMPRMDGYRLCHEVRSIEKFKDIPFIVYTSTFTTTPDEKLAFEFGADRFIRKPAPLRVILEALELARPQGRDRRARPAESVAEFTPLHGYSEVLVRKLEHRNAELQLTKEQLLRTNSELVERTEELQTAKAKLEFSANQLQSLFDNLEDVFFSVNLKERRLVHISPACEKIYGLPQSAFMNNPMLWRELIVPADRDLIEAGEADLYQGRLWQSEYRIQKPDGDVGWVQSKIKPFLDRTGALVRIDGIVSDISARKQLEVQLLHSQKLEGVGRLAGGIAHDFNNLLTAILGYSELALGTLEQGNPVRESISEIMRAGEQASGLTRQLLAFSRKQILDPQILDLNSVVANAKNLLQRLIGEDIQLTTLLPSGLRSVRADPGQIEQVIVNLAVNARDAMPEGGSLTIETANIELDQTYVHGRVVIPAGHYLMLAVSDTGSGMSPEVQSHIFEPFFTTKAPGKGTGLGLATVYGIIKQSGGYIWLHSDLGKGTTFKIYLPTTEHEAQLIVPVPELLETPNCGGTILVVEDEEPVRKLILRVLRSRGYNVIEARDGAHALQLWTDGPGEIDLLLTDTVMPNMGGAALSQRLKLAQPEIKVLYMSGYTDDAVILQQLLVSGAAFLQKPFGPDALARKISEVLNST